MNIFDDKMVCDSCGTPFYQYKNENGRNYWSCMGGQECPRNVVSEDAMIEFISRRLWSGDRHPKKILNFIMTKVEKIKVKNAYDFTVLIRGQDPMIWAPPNWYY